MSRKLIFGLVLGFFSMSAALLPAQVDSTAQDSTSVFEYSEYMELLMTYHPMARQAGLMTERGEALLLKARGLFDPYLYGDYSGKRFQGKNYYQRLETGVKLPTWFGVQGFAGYQNNAGEFLNLAENVPDVGLLQAGLEVNLGKGLLIDHRRAELLKAKWYPAITEAERRIMLNELVVRATDAYWNWWVAWNQMAVYRDAVLLAEIRFRGVKSGFVSGDEPAIDTLESRIQVQSRQFSYNEARVKYAQAAFILSNFLWDETGEPLLLADDVVPPTISGAMESTFADSLPSAESLLEQHPDLLVLDIKRQQLEVDRRWAAEQLKPELSLKAGALIQPGADRGTRPFYEDHTLGVSLSFPLFLRKARGELALTDLEIQSTELKLAQKAWSLENKINTLYAKISNTKAQIILYTDLVKNTQGLLNAEVRKFGIGESSLFLVNAREQKLFKSQIELIYLRAGLPILYAELYEAVGGYGVLY
jgi:outer membrane protein TolC